MTKLKKTLLLALMLIFFISPTLVGCNWNVSSSDKLNAPNITLDADNNCLTWSGIENATGYDVYCNDTLMDSIDLTTQTVVYDLTGILSDSGSYELQVAATSDSVYVTNSERSNKVTYDYVKKQLIIPTTLNSKIDSSSEILFTLSDTGHLTYIPFQTEGYEYILYLYSNSSGLKSYTLSNKTIDLHSGEYLTKNEIYAIRMGYKKDDITTICNNILYYNPDSYGDYTNKIYLFDGYINDYYIESLQELKNLVYYTFINRIEDYNLKVSNSFKNFVSNSYQGSYMTDKMNSVVEYCYTQFYETMSYYSNNTNNGFVVQLSNSTEYNIKVSYGGVTQCDVTINPSSAQTYSQVDGDTYYTIKDYESLGDNYDDFASDKQFLQTTVTTSEQLYWAIENKITPIISNAECRAYTIYNKAKNVLRDIISPDMTDYEKALAIFDWITVNTKYDYTKYTVANGYSVNLANYPTKLPCFYLEGVFVTGYSVCDGFSKAFSMMCNMLGIDAIRIMGDAKVGETFGGHAWNKVLMDKDTTDENPAEYYLVDITWTEIVGASGEELSHTYFGLSDEDVEDTHFEYSGRKDKFNNYSSANNIRYYKLENVVAENTTDLQKLFEKMVVDNRKSMEIIINYDYMVDEYEKVYGENSYRSSNKVDKTYYENHPTLVKSMYEHATDTMYYYEWELVDGSSIFNPEYEISNQYVYHNYKLNETFKLNVMKPNKFQEQYIFITDGNDIMEYDDNGNEGIVFIFTQNLLLDNEGELEHLTNFIKEKNIKGTFTLYVKNTILNTATGNSSLEKVLDLFDGYLDNVNFELLADNYVYDSQEMLVASVFSFTIS